MKKSDGTNVVIDVTRWRYYQNGTCYVKTLNGDAKLVLYQDEKR